MSSDKCLILCSSPVSLHVVSDVLIAFTYLCIAVSVSYITSTERDLKRGQFKLGVISVFLFILCGLLLAINSVDPKMPVFAIEGSINAFAVILSVATAGSLIMLLPRIAELRSAKTMQLEMAAQRESAVLLSAVIELVPGLVCAKDGSGRMLFANQVLLDAIGRRWEDVKDKCDTEFLDDAHQAALIMANDRHIMEGGKSQELEEIVDHPELGSRVYLSTKVPLSLIDERMDGLVCFAVDITERERNTQDLLHAARRTAMGDVAAAIAHELNQPLAAVSLYLGGTMILLANDDCNEPVMEALTLANEQCLRAGEIIRQVRGFVSGADDVKRPECISTLVNEACGLALLGMRDSGIATSIEHRRADIAATVHKVQIEQVVVNLVRNAIDAMGNAEGSALKITTGLNASGMVMVSVKDNGPGINAEVANRLFEPFVSTKGVKGMGVGLSISRTIIEKHGGKIWAGSDPATGTIFHFTLPLLDREVAECPSLG